MAKYVQCPHCLQSFDTDVVNIERHKESCARHIRETVEAKSKDFWKRVDSNKAKA